jgi:hypothetical protein
MLIESVSVMSQVKDENVYKGDCEYEKCVDIMNKVRYLWW